MAAGLNGGGNFIERLESRHMLATLYWDPDRNATNNNYQTGAGLGGASGTWSDGGAAVWFNPSLNAGNGGYVSWNSTLGDTAVFFGPVPAAATTVTISGDVSAAAVEFRSAGYVVTGGSFTTAVSGTTFSVFPAASTARFDTAIAGTGGIAKTGSATLTLGAPSNTYTGNTLVMAGMLDVQGTIQSHVQTVTASGGSVSGVLFYDPDLAAAVREALALLPTDRLTADVIAKLPQLTSLTVNGTTVGDLTGISALSALTSLELIPADYATPAQGISSLAPLAGLTNLTNLALQDVGLTDTALATLPALTGLTRLDVRYNALSAVPKAVADLPQLGTLLVHGNPLLTDKPRDGLATLKGKAIDVDVAPDRPDIATTIDDLAKRLYYLPLKMLEYVTNTVAYQPYVGAMKGPLATLQTKAGNDWDTNSLLAALYSTAGITTRYVEGVAEVTPQQLMDYVGTRDAAAAANILWAAGLKADDSAYRFKHTWLEAKANVPATGVLAWVPIDASWKLRDYRPGLPGVLASVPFSAKEVDYLTDPKWKAKSTAEYYEAKVSQWLAANRPDITIADVGYDGPIRQQAFKSLPTRLPYNAVNEPQDTAKPLAIPATAQYTVNIKLANGSKQLFGAAGADLSLADVSLSRLTIDPGLAGTGSTRTAQPILRRDGVKIATASETIAAPESSNSLPQLTLTISVTAPAGGQTFSRSFTRAADRFIAIGLDANQFSESLLVGKRAVVNAQQINRAKAAAIDNEQAVGGLLDLAIAQYFSAANADEASLASLTSAVVDRTIVALGIATSAATLSEPTADTTRLQFPYQPADIGIDVPANVCGGFAIDASTREIDLNRNLLLGYTNSSLEGLVIEELTNCESVSTMKAFQLSVLGAFNVTIPNVVPTKNQALENLVEINAATVGSIDTLLPGVRQTIRDAIASTVKKGLTGVDSYAGVTFTALVPKNEITVGGGSDTTKQWKGVGYTLTCVTSDPAKARLNGMTVGFIIHGGVDGAISANGGAASRVVTPPPLLRPALSIFNPGLSAGDPVNMATGGVYHEETDVEIPNLGVPLAFRRRYDSIHTVSGLAGASAPWSDRGMGEGWSFTYSDRIESGTDGADTVTWFTDTGMRLVFTKTAGKYINPAGVFGTLTSLSTGGFQWTDADAMTTSFGTAVGGFFPVVFKSDRFGNGVKIEYVPGTTKISLVSDLRDPTRQLVFKYNTDTPSHVSTVSDSTGRTWVYGYSPDGRLQTRTAPAPVATAAVSVVRYDYHLDAARRGLLSQVTDPRGLVTAWEYYANRRGFRVTDAEALQHSFSVSAHHRHPLCGADVGLRRQLSAP